jgi:hypothetical protein
MPFPDHTLRSAPEVAFTVTDADVQRLRAFRPARLRLRLLEGIVHLLGAFVAALVTFFTLLARRADRLPVNLGIVATGWGLLWAYVAFFFFRPSTASRLWFAKLVRSPVLTRGACRAGVTEEVLTVVTPNVTRAFRADQLESCVFDGHAFLVRTMEGDVIIVPRRAFESQDEFAMFIRAVQTREHQTSDRDNDGDD